MTAPTEVDPRELMTRAQAGDTRAFGELYTRYRPLVYSIAREHHPRHADDITQDTFTRAFAKLHTWQDQGHQPSAWLRTIANRVCVDRSRSRYEQRVDLDADAGVYHVADPDVTEPERLAVRADRVRDVREALAKLSPGQQVAMTAYYLKETPVAEIAAARGSSRVAVRRLLFDGRNRMREVLADV